jgi:hypothetical protein
MPFSPQNHVVSSPSYPHLPDSLNHPLNIDLTCPAFRDYTRSDRLQGSTGDPTSASGACQHRQPGPDAYIPKSTRAVYRSTFLVVFERFTHRTDDTTLRGIEQRPTEIRNNPRTSSSTGEFIPHLREGGFEYNYCRFESTFRSFIAPTNSIISGIRQNSIDKGFISISGSNQCRVLHIEWIRETSPGFFEWRLSKRFLENRIDILEGCFPSLCSIQRLISIDEIDLLRQTDLPNVAAFGSIYHVISSKNTRRICITREICSWTPVTIRIKFIRIKVGEIGT